MRLLEFWRPFRVVAARRVSEEEQVTVEAYAATEAQATARLEGILTVFRDHRKRSNEEVVRATQQHLTALEQRIKVHSDELYKLGEELEAKRIEVRKYDDMLQAKKKRLGLHGVE